VSVVVACGGSNAATGSASATKVTEAASAVPSNHDRLDSPTMIATPVADTVTATPDVQGAKDALQAFFDLYNKGQWGP